MRRVTPFIVLVVLTPVACGGGGESASASSSRSSDTNSSSKSNTLSEEEFLEQANKICADAEEELSERSGDRLLDRPETQGVAEFQVQFFLEETAPAIEEQLNEIAELGAPDELTDDIDKFLEDARRALQDLVEQLEDDPEADVGDNPFSDIAREAQALGLDECAA